MVRIFAKSSTRRIFHRGRPVVGVAVAAVAAWAIVVGAGPAAAAGYTAIVVEAESGKVLHEVDADNPKFPASLTKMMTLYMVFEALTTGRLTLDQKLAVSRVAAGRSPSKLGLKRGQRISVRDVIGTLVTKSANDAATVAAEALGGSERKFARMMTAKARALGMSSTTFRNASGLPHWRQRSTARDMALLARALWRDFPDHYHYFSLAAYTYGGRSFRNHNRLLTRYDGLDGIKTGYIRASGYNIAASAERDGRRVIAVIFGGRSQRWRDGRMAKLLNRGFATLQGPEIPVVPVRAKAWPPPPKRKPLLVAAGEVEQWAVQVGAYTRFATAHLAVTRAARLVPALLRIPVSIRRTRGDDGSLYRARLVGMSEAKARRACTRLVRRSIGCVVVPADDTVGVGSR